jgi:hypothetical protein
MVGESVFSTLSYSFGELKLSYVSVFFYPAGWYVAAVELVIRFTWAFSVSIL